MDFSLKFTHGCFLSQGKERCVFLCSGLNKGLNPHRPAAGEVLTLGEADFGPPQERSKSKSYVLQTHSEPGHQQVRQFSQTTLYFKRKKKRCLYLAALLKTPKFDCFNPSFPLQPISATSEAVLQGITH